MNGSFTVEAALLMTVLIPLLTALIYLGFYQHDKVWIANKTKTEAMEAALDQDRKNQTDWSGVLAASVCSRKINMAILMSQLSSMQVIRKNYMPK